MLGRGWGEDKEWGGKRKESFAASREALDQFKASMWVSAGVIAEE